MWSYSFSLSLSPPPPSPPPLSLSLSLSLSLTAWKKLKAHVIALSLSPLGQAAKRRASILHRKQRTASHVRTAQRAWEEEEEDREREREREVF